MRKFDYETPGLTVAEFGKLVQGASAPGKAQDNDQGTEDIF